ncbi:hypothetical protein HYS93_03910 [Candidatus Daviesbacteria bacterium]|nr:hypothetical protein [Candidatus Daviesbacteria bacterium]
MSIIEDGEYNNFNEILRNARELEVKASQLHRARVQTLGGLLKPSDFGMETVDNQTYAYVSPKDSLGRNYTIVSVPKKDIKTLESVSDYLMKAWDTNKPEATASELITILDMGGIVLAANCDGEMIGANQVLAGRDSDNQPALISDQLAVSPDHRSHSIGRIMKQLVFCRALEQDTTRVYVTFDPRRQNLWNLNVERLGGKIVGFEENKYGAHLLGAFNPEDLPTDRVIVLWDLLDPFTLNRIHNPRNGIRIEGVDLVEKPISFGDDEQAFIQRRQLLGQMLRDHIIVGITQDGILQFAPRSDYRVWGETLPRYLSGFTLKS